MTFLRKIILLGLFTIFMIDVSFSAPVRGDFSGTWCQHLNNHDSAFSIIIERKFDVYVGSYGSVILGGSKIDDNDDAFSFKATKSNIIKTKIKAGISGNIGLIQLKLLNNKKIE
jgi:hypothetical protein